MLVRQSIRVLVKISISNCFWSSVLPVIPALSCLNNTTLHKTYILHFLLPRAKEAHTVESSSSNRSLSLVKNRKASPSQVMCFFVVGLRLYDVERCLPIIGARLTTCTAVLVSALSISLQEWNAQSSKFLHQARQLCDALDQLMNRVWSLRASQAAILHLKSRQRALSALAC